MSIATRESGLGAVIAGWTLAALAAACSAHICIVADTNSGPPPGSPGPGYPPPCIEGYENTGPDMMPHWLIIETGLPADDDGNPTQLNALARLVNFDILLETEGGTLGGQLQIFTADLQLHLFGTGLLEGFDRAITVPVLSETHTGPVMRGMPDDPASMFEYAFDTAIFNLHGAIYDDEDFEEFHILAGTDHKHECPGHSMYTTLASGDFWIDSHFELNCHITLMGAMGGALEGVEAMTHGHTQMHAGGPFCAADGDLNLEVNHFDLQIVLDAWGMCGDKQPEGLPCFGDVTRDGAVNVDDLLGVINAWGPCQDHE